MSKAYVLFYRLNEGITEIFLLKSFQGIKKEGEELTTFCKDVSGNRRNPIDITEEINNNKILGVNQGIINIRPHKLSENRIIYVSNDKGFYNLPGGQAEKGETVLETALREVEEELYIPKDIFRPYLEKSLLIRNIYYVDYDEIDNELIKNILVNNENISHLGNVCNIPGIELSEFGIQKWVDVAKYNRIFKNPSNKFYNLANNIPIKIPSKIVMDGGDYYIKYLKYKAKYIKLLSQKN
jgi:8-oxo-dGTP pyrophosphatase MutT (NUDIX family)